MRTEIVLFALVVGIIATSGCIDGQEAPDVPEDDFDEPAPEEPGEEDIEEEPAPGEQPDDDLDEEPLPE